MVTCVPSGGLIVTAAGRPSAKLDELVASSGWPVLPAARPRRLREEVQMLTPTCLLFWLETLQDVSPTARLVRWARQYASRPYRVAVAYRLHGEVEAPLRSAGLHVYVPASGDVRAVLKGTVWPWLESHADPGDHAALPTLDPRRTERGPLNVGTFPELGRPP